MEIEKIIRSDFEKISEILSSWFGEHSNFTEAKCEIYKCFLATRVSKAAGVYLKEKTRTIKKLGGTRAAGSGFWKWNDAYLLAALEINSPDYGHTTETSETAFINDLKKIFDNLAIKTSSVLHKELSEIISADPELIIKRRKDARRRIALNYGIANITIVLSRPVEITMFSALGDGIDGKKYRELYEGFWNHLTNVLGYKPTIGPKVEKLSIALDMDWEKTRSDWVKNKVKKHPEDSPGGAKPVPKLDAVMEWPNIAFQPLSTKAE